MENSTIKSSPSGKVQQQEQRNIGFFDLPPELRSMIYDQAIGRRIVSWKLFLQNDVVGMTKDTPKDFKVPTRQILNDTSTTTMPCDIESDPLGFKVMQIINKQPNHAAVLMRTCRTLSQEILPILYHRTKFNLKISWTITGTQSDEFLDIEDRVPSTILSRIRNMKLDISHIPTPAHRPIFHTIATTLINRSSQDANACKSILLDARTVAELVWRQSPLWRSEDFVTLLESLTFKGVFIVELESKLPENYPCVMESWLAVEHGIEKLRVFDGGDYAKSREDWRAGTGGKVVGMERVKTERDEKLMRLLKKRKGKRERAEKERGREEEEQAKSA